MGWWLKVWRDPNISHLPIWLYQSGLTEGRSSFWGVHASKFGAS